MTDNFAVGDYVRVVIEGEIDSLDSKEVNVSGYFFNREEFKSIQKIDRPRPPLPTKIGAVIESQGRRYFLVGSKEARREWLTDQGYSALSNTLYNSNWKLIAEGRE